MLNCRFVCFSASTHLSPLFRLFFDALFGAAAAAVVAAASPSNYFGCNELKCRDLTLSARIQSEREREREGNSEVHLDGSE